MVNEYFKLNNYGYTLEYYLFELANFSVLAFLVLFLYKLRVINSNSLIVWVGLFFSPLLINYFILSPWMYGDQFVYAGELMSLKTTGQSIESIASNTIPGIWNPVTLTAKILGLAPLATWMTVTSVAFANKFFLFITFLWFKNFFDDENEVLLYFLVPSLVLYSSMGLRDTLIMIASVVILINLLRGRYLIISLLMLYPLIYLKIQMFAFLSLYLIARIVFQAHKHQYLLILFIAFLVVGCLIFQNQILDVLNLYRLAFAAEDFTYNQDTSYRAFNVFGRDQIDPLFMPSIFDAGLTAILNLPALLLIPLPWNWSNIFYPIQSLESCLLIYLYYKIALRDQLYKTTEFKLLTLILLIGLLVYAVIMSNEGTFVRYRFTLYYPFLLAAFYLSHQSDKALKNR